MIDGKSISCLIDAGCSTNIINLATYQYLKRATKIQLKTTKVSFSKGSCPHYQES